MAHALARYDEFAEWYEQWIGAAPPLIAAHADLLPAAGRLVRRLDRASVHSRK